MVAMLVAVLLQGLLILGLSRIIPGVRLSGYKSAVAVAVVYGVLGALLKSVLVVLSLPLVVLSLGLFLLVINGFLLWLTDKILEGFEIRSPGSLAVMTVALTAGNVLVQGAVRGLG